jgi:hypothetical protein
MQQVQCIKIGRVLLPQLRSTVDLTQTTPDGLERLNPERRSGGVDIVLTSQIWIEAGIIPAADWSDIDEVCKVMLGGKGYELSWKRVNEKPSHNVSPVPRGS